MLNKPQIDECQDQACIRSAPNHAKPPSGTRPNAAPFGAHLNPCSSVVCLLGNCCLEFSLYLTGHVPYLTPTCCLRDLRFDQCFRGTSHPDATSRGGGMTPLCCAALFSPVLLVAGQAIGQTNPWQAVFHPRMVGWPDRFGMIQRAYCHVYLVRLCGGHESKAGAARAAERPKPTGPSNDARFTLAKAKLTDSKRCPRDEWRAGAPPTIQAMTVRHIVRFPRRLITHRSAQAAALELSRIADIVHR
jgi:hypothetical protein